MIIPTGEIYASDKCFVTQNRENKSKVSEHKENVEDKKIIPADEIYSWNKSHKSKHGEEKTHNTKDKWKA